MPQWHVDFLSLDAANRISIGVGVTLAVVDTGVDDAHPDLAGAIVDGIDYSLGPSIFGDRPDGRTDTDGHGTGMAGLISAHGRTRGIAPGARVQPVRVGMSATSFGEVSYAAALSWATEGGAQVISMSNSAGQSPALTRAIDDARARDVVIVAAAGNLGQQSRIEYPAAFESVLAVGAVDRDGKRADFSLTGPELDIMAPGVDITSPGLNGGYSVHTSGTSDATAIVSGAVALVRSKYPQLTAPQVIELLTSTADDKGPPGRDDEYGYGVLNIVRALTAPLPTTQAAAPPSDSGPSKDMIILGGVVIIILLSGAGLAFVGRRRK